MTTATNATANTNRIINFYTTKADKPAVRTFHPNDTALVMLIANYHELHYAYRVYEKSTTFYFNNGVSPEFVDDLKVGFKISNMYSPWNYIENSKEVSLANVKNELANCDIRAIKSALVEHVSKHYITSLKEIYNMPTITNRSQTLALVYMTGALKNVLSTLKDVDAPKVTAEVVDSTPFDEKIDNEFSELIEDSLMEEDNFDTGYDDVIGSPYYIDVTVEDDMIDVTETQLIVYIKCAMARQKLLLPAGEKQHLVEKTVKQLRAICKARGLNGYSRLRKTELISFLTEAMNTVIA